MYLIMCCNTVQSALKMLIKPRKYTTELMMSNGLDLKNEYIFYLKNCSICGGSRITVFAECNDGTGYFVDRIKSKNVKSFLKNNPPLKGSKTRNTGGKSSGNIPLYYYDKGKKFACKVNYASLKIVPYDTDVLRGLERKSGRIRQ